MPKATIPFDPDDYAPVADRIQLFYHSYPRGRINTHLVSRTVRETTFLACVYRAPDERIKPDALGNSYSLFDSTNARSPSSEQVTTLPRSLSYQAGTGRLMASNRAGRTDAYEYDVAGNTVFFWQSYQDGQTGTVLENRASFYAIDGRLRAADYRKTTVGANRFAPETWWWDTFFEEFRYDALGRRVLVRHRKRCPEFGDGPRHWCTLSTIRRTVWDGDEELYEIQMPGGDEVNADTLENDTLFIHREPAQAPPYLSYFDANPQFGRVAYLHATGLDVPISLVRINYEDQPYPKTYQAWTLPFVIVPRWNWRGQAEYGTYGDGSYKRCYPGDAARCVQVQWSTKAFAFQDPGTDTLGSWVGTLIEEKRDATGTQYRRNRYVDPATGRFTQEDPIGMAGGLNLYGFANGDPINFSDPFGLCLPWPACALAAAGTGARVGTATGAIIGTIFGTPGAGTITGAGAGRLIGATIGFGLATAGAIWLATKEASDDAPAPEPTAGEIISAEKKGSINRVFPEEMRDKTRAEIDALAKAGDKAAKTAKKLLTDKRFNKEQ
jgi:RHS repeat-associated protein